jgi:peptide chain release factor 2
MEREAASPGYWDNPKRAQGEMQRLVRLKETVTLWRDLSARTADLLELTELGLEEGDYSLQEQIEADAREISRTLAKEEINLTLSGPYDDRPAILLIHSGAGGTDSHDWAEMLLGMYTKWAETQGRAMQVMDLSYGEEAGLRGASLEIGGQFAYGYLCAERGVHRLVRLSPFDPNHLRHTSFARIEVLPVASEEETEVLVRPEDLKLDFFRSSGPGGQNVQKVASAVRLTHLPTGIVVTCQTERSQHQNREYAMRILEARMLALQSEKRAEELEKLRGELVSAQWGNQIRSYVLHPYQSVKDHRTNHQSTNPSAVLAGDLNNFIEAYLMSQVGRD